MSPAAITLPPGLTPRDGRFGSGPSLVRTEALSALAATGATYLGTSHRRPGVRDVVARIRAGLAALYGLPDGYEVALGNGGATLFWDAAVATLIERRSLHYTFGAFSDRFAAAVTAAPHLDPPDTAAAPPGSRPDPVGATGADAVAETHNETSTGVWMPVHRPRGDALVLVDATSAAGAMEVDPAHFDAYYFSPQKAFGAEGGLWLALLSPAAVERVERLAAGRAVPAMLDLAAALAASRRDQTVNTPALATLFLLADQIEWMAARGGLAAAAEHCRRASSVLYEWAERSERARPFVTDPAHRSPTVVSLEIEGPDAAEVSDVLEANGYLDTRGYRKMGGNTVRFGMFPNVALDDVERLAAALDHVLERL